ncbi:MAG: Nascent polypeptide-associated complex protein [Promethearchaeota archaeon]|nr:MAG: Nascent polypeptide-associated complex protein [Candidatus Lokiarchaeota archaeon]
MVKLPKELQKKKKSHPKRRSPTKKRSGGSKLASRQMRRKMQQQGIDMDQIEATRVVIEGPEKTIVIEQPEVVQMKQMGQEIYQVIGSAEEYPSDEIFIEEGEEKSKVEEEEIEEEAKPSITENDVMLVAAQANVTKEEAQAALNQTQGDIAKAILYLKNRP